MPKIEVSAIECDVANFCTYSDVRWRSKATPRKMRTGVEEEHILVANSPALQRLPDLIMFTSKDLERTNRA